MPCPYDPALNARIIKNVKMPIKPNAKPQLKFLHLTLPPLKRRDSWFIASRYGRTAPDTAYILPLKREVLRRFSITISV